jgi:hypothetical protein
MARRPEERHWDCRSSDFSGGPKSPARRGIRRRYSEVALKGHRSLRGLVVSLAVAGLLLLLTGCQGLTGGSTGTGTVGLGSGSLSFGSVPVGSSKTMPDTITNNTASSVTISAILGAGSGFQVTGIAVPLTLAAGQSASFDVKFQSTSAGDPTVTISFDGPNAQPYASLSASATAVTQGTLAPSPSPVAFGNVSVGASQTSTVTLQNNGESSLSITSATMSGAGFTMSNLALPLTINAGTSASAKITFAPTGAGSFSGSVTFGITTNQTNTTVVLNLSGTGVTAVTPGALTANPTSLALGSVQVGNSTSLSETLTNTGGSSVTISQANVTGAVFSLSGLTLPLTLTSTQSVTFAATFKPTSAGAVSGSVSVVSNASNSPLNIGLSGTGTAAGTLAVSPTSLSFGNVTVGVGSPLTGSLTASGASVTVSSASLNNSEFVLSGISLPVTLAAGKSAGFTVTFTPQASGATTASLSFSSNASNSPAAQSMTGTGTAATQHTADLTWNASADAVSYNIYRSTVSGGPYTMINTSPDSTTSYTDSTVVSGDTYYYVATAVNASSEESGYSNQATAAVPSP